MKFGFIGTNWITDRLIEAGKSVSSFEPYAVYSRKMETAEAFKEKYDLSYATDDMEAFLSHPDIDAVYIATPNLLHHEQTISALQHGKHVLCEKPLTISRERYEAIMAASEASDAVFMEAMKSIYAPSFLKVEEWIHEIGVVRRANFHYNQYSSRYDKYKEGIIENAFKPELGNGALTDLGVYTISPLVKLFGMPETIHAAGEFLSTGADGQGTALCDYKEMTAVLMYSKIIDSYLPSEIIGEEGMIIIDKISAPNEVKRLDRQGKVIETFSSPELPMTYEIEAFIKAIETGDTHLLNHETSMNTIEVLEHISKQLNLKFPEEL